MHLLVVCGLGVFFIQTEGLLLLPRVTSVVLSSNKRVRNVYTRVGGEGIKTASNVTARLCGHNMCWVMCG